MLVRATNTMSFLLKLLLRDFLLSCLIPLLNSTLFLSVPIQPACSLSLFLEVFLVERPLGLRAHELSLTHIHLASEDEFPCDCSYIIIMQYYVYSSRDNTFSPSLGESSQDYQGQYLLSNLNIRNIS